MVLRRRLPCLTFVLCGCATYETVEEACRDEVVGEDEIDDPDVVDFFRRVDCFRNLAGLTQAAFDPRVQEASEAHVAYLAEHARYGTLEENLEYPWTYETEGLSGFTGTSVYERLEAVSYPIQSGGLSPYDTAYLHADVGGAAVDACIGDPGFREWVLRPAWQDGGWARSTFAEDGVPFAYGTVVVPWVSSEGAARPIAFPVDGQRDVPTSGVICGLGDPHWGEAFGFPITLTFADGNGRESYANAAFVETPVLTGPDGPVEMEVRGLGEQTRQTLSVLPLAFYEPDADYTFTTRVRFGSWEQNVDIAFHTAE